MNPSTVRTRADQMKVREAYLEILKVQQENLNKTANAVKMFSQTGQTPIAPQDTRSMSEKFSDIENLKQNLRKMLTSLTESSQINTIINALTEEEVQGVSLLYGDIEKNLQPRFKSGVPAPIFIEFVRRYLKDYSKNLGLSTGLQDVVASELKLTRNMLSQIIPNQAIMRDLISAISSAPPSPQQSMALSAAQNLASSLPDPNDILSASSTLNPTQYQDLTDLTNDALQPVPTAAQVQGLTKDINDVLRSGNVRDATNILGETLKFIQLQQNDIQNLQDISDVVQQKQTLESIPKAQAVETSQSELANIARMMKAKETKIQIGTRIDRNGKEVPVFSADKTVVPKENLTEKDIKQAKIVNNIEKASAEELQTLKITKTAVIAFYDYISKRDQNRALSGSDKTTLNASSIEELRQLLIADKESGGLAFTAPPAPVITAAQAATQTAANIGGVALGGVNIPQLANEDVAAGRIQSSDVFDNFGLAEKLEYILEVVNRGGFDNFPNVRETIETFFKTTQAQGQITDEEVNDFYRDIKQITGMGLRRKSSNKGKNVIFGMGMNQIIGKVKQPKLFPSKVDFHDGYQPDKSYIPFGRYVINKHKLGDNKLMVKTISGGAIPKLPTLCISSELGKIIKKMVGGAMPTYNEMNSLNEEDQNTLYKVFKLAQIDKVDFLPAPNKSKEEEQMNRFMILKGQIQAGNDNKELVKEFKLMLLKFINGGKIPKSQGMDIVCDLMALGY